MPLEVLQLQGAHFQEQTPHAVQTRSTQRGAQPGPESVQARAVRGQHRMCVGSEQRQVRKRGHVGKDQLGSLGHLSREVIFSNRYLGAVQYDDRL
jgi:hypothetical protein